MKSNVEKWIELQAEQVSDELLQVLSNHAGPLIPLVPPRLFRFVHEIALTRVLVGVAKSGLEPEEAEKLAKEMVALCQKYEESESEQGVPPFHN